MTKNTRTRDEYRAWLLDYQINMHKRDEATAERFVNYMVETYFDKGFTAESVAIIFSGTLGKFVEECRKLIDKKRDQFNYDITPGATYEGQECGEEFVLSNTPAWVCVRAYINRKNAEFDAYMDSRQQIDDETDAAIDIELARQSGDWDEHDRLTTERATAGGDPWAYAARHHMY